jgi:hypothetical protein
MRIHLAEIPKHGTGLAASMVVRQVVPAKKERAEGEGSHPYLSSVTWALSRCPGIEGKGNER